MENLLTKLKGLIRQAIITFITDDSEKYPLMTVNYNGKTADVIRISPYGLCSNPANSIFSLVVNSSASESQKFGIPVDFINRLKNLSEGEVALHNSKAGNYVYLNKDGIAVLNGDTDFAVAYDDLKTAFDILKTEVNALITVYNSHASHPPANGVPAIADMSGAKVPTIKVP